MKICVNRWLNFFGALGAGLIVIVFCLILLWRDPFVFWNDDYQVSILPVFADVARSWGEGHLPLLSPYSWICSNLVGEFQYGTFSIFVNSAVVLIWKLLAGFSEQAAALSITHLVVLAIGGFLLARGRNLSRPLSIMVALVAALNGWIICWGATDWFGALGAFAWLPWAWWGLERAADTRRSHWRFLWPAPFVYLVVTGGFPYTVVMMLLLIAWVGLRSLGQTRAVTSLWPILLGVALGFGIAAPAWLAIFDYVRGSAREIQPASAHWQWLVPPAGLPGLILPCWTVKWADFSTRYVPHAAAELSTGLVPPLALIGALVVNGRALIRKLHWEFGLLLIVLVIAMLPSAGVFRWSFRWLPFFHLILVLSAAEALGGIDWTWRHKRNAMLVALLLTGVTTIAMSILGTTGKYAFPLAWILLSLVAIWALAEFVLRDSRLRAWIPPSITLAAFLTTYLCIPPNCGVPKYNFTEKLLEPAPLDRERLYLSVYLPAEFAYRIETRSEPVGQIVRPGSTSMWSGLRFVNGYSPIITSGVGREFKAYIHGEIDSLVAERLLTQEAGPAGELASLGVDGIVVSTDMWFQPQPSSEWELVASNAEGRVFHRRTPPFAPIRSLDSVESRPHQRFVRATISGIQNLRNRAEADVDVPEGSGPALISFARPYFGGYEARLGDRKLAVSSERNLFPVVEIPDGSNGHLVLIYRPWWLLYGGTVAITCVVFFLSASLIALREKRIWMR